MQNTLIFIAPFGTVSKQYYDHCVTDGITDVMICDLDDEELDCDPRNLDFVTFIDESSEYYKYVSGVIEDGTVCVVP